MKKKGNVVIYMILVAAVLLAKVLGLVRGILLGYYYGTGIEASAFSAVSNLPLLVFDITFGTAISSAFVPVFNEKLAGGDRKGANRFASNFLNIVLLFAFIVVLIGILFPKLAIRIVANGLVKNVEAYALAQTLVRIIMPIMCFACCTFIFIGVLQSYGEFIAPALVSLCSNLAMILYFIFFNRFFGIKGLAAAFCLGWFLQLVFLLPFLKKKQFSYSFVFDFTTPEIKRTAILTLPLLISAFAQPINQLISYNFSSHISESGVATVNYAYNAYFIVAGVFSYALTNMLFPEMSRRFASKDVEGATVICRDMLSNITAIIMPIMVFLACCAVPVIRILYERGEFTAADTANVAGLLAVYSLGMIFLSWQDILNKYFYSMQKSVIPMVAAGVGIAANLLLSTILTPVLGLYALALSTVVAGALMTLILSLFTLRVTRIIFRRELWIELIKLIISGAVVYAVCTLLMHVLNFNSSLVLQVVFIVLTLVAALIVYLAMLFILRSKNLGSIIKIFRKEGKTDVGV